MRKLFAFLLILTWMCMRMHIQAQTYTMLSSGNSTITTCSGVIYDPGGTGDYPSNCDSYLTIYPGSGGSKVRLTGTYNTEGTTYAWDYFNVYDGTSNTGTQLGSFHGLGTCDVISLTGPLTIYFHSDGSVQHAGFELNVSCCTDVCACSSPTGVHIRTGNQFIKVLWDPSMLTNGYFLEYGPHGFTPGAGSRTYTSATSYTLTNLINDTEYDIYIWFDCGNDHRITTELPVMVSATPGSNCTMTSGTREFEICNGFVYDNGGPTGNYSNYSNDTLIIYPATNGCKVSIVGTYYTESASFDYIKIYDGAGVAGTMLGKFAETGTITEPIYSTSPDGTLTVVFHSDGSVQKSGYEFQVACICYVDHVQDTVCYKERYQNHGFDTSLAYSGDYTLIRVANSTLIDVDLHVRPSPYVSIAGRYYFCADGDITLTANNAVSYAWSTGEHSQSIHVHDIGSYQVTITDSHGCVASASHRIAPIDEFIDMIDFPTMCAGKDYLITGSYESGSEILMHRVQSTLSSADTAFLPDGIACDPYGCSYRSTLTFTDYSSNAYVRDANDIYYVKINMEHSYIGDIYINITCPTGQKADIMRWSGSGSTECNSQIPTSATGWQSGDNYMYAYFGQAYDYQDYNDYCDRNSSSNAPGIGWNYCWSNNTTQGFVYAATPGSLVYRSANVHAGIVDSSDVAGGTQFYHPDQAFSSLVGCPLNGDWYIEVVDGYGADNGYIFGWELALTEELLPNNTFNVSEITPVGPWIAGMTSDTSFTISPPGTLQEDTTVQYLLHFYDSDNCSYDTLVRVSVNTLHYGDTVASACESFTWHGVTYTQSGSYNDTLQTSAGCDSIVTLHLTIDTPPDPPTVSPSTLICPGDMVTLTAECEDAILLTEGFSSITNGGDENASAPGSDTIHCNTLATFPIMSYVYPAGGKVKFGKGSYANTAIPGSMTSVPLNLSRPFKVVVRAKNWAWGGQTGGNVDGTLVITAGSQTLTQTVNTSQYSDYTFNFNAAGLTPITIASNLSGWRLIIDSVYITMEKECAYTWSASPSTEILPDIHAQSITAHPEETTTFTLHQTSNSCTLDTSITVSVVPPPTITGGGFICEGESVTLTAECPDLVVLEEDFSMCTTVNANILNGDIPTFPVTDKVRTDTDTGSVILGIGGMGTTTTGEITSIPLDLTSDFKVTVRARKKNNDVEMYVVVGSETRHQTVASTDFADYEFDFTGQPGWGQETIHIYNELPGGSVVNGLKRLSITNVQVEMNCTYTWTATPAMTMADPHTQSISVSPAETTLFSLQQSSGNCMGDAATTVYVVPPVSITGEDWMCEGDTVTLTAECPDLVVLEEDFSMCTTVNANILNGDIPTFPVTDKVRTDTDTGIVILGIGGMGTTTTGEITSIPLDLTSDFKVTVRARKKNNDVEMYVVVGSEMRHQTVASTDFADYEFDFTGQPGWGQETIHIYNELPGGSVVNGLKRLSITDVQVQVEPNCTYTWTASPALTITDPHAQSITVSPAETTVFTLTQTTDNCTQNVAQTVTVSTPNHQSYTIETCESYTWASPQGDGQTYSASGDYLWSHNDSNGCLQVDTLHLIINQPVTTTTSATACESYTWNGQTYTLSDEYTQTFTASNGCDSVVTLNLTVNVPTTGVDEQEVCDHLTWIDGVTYTASTDTPTCTLTSSTGCDSIVTLHLTIHEPTTGDTTAVECGRFDWYEHENLTRSGDYTHVFVGGNAAGCDSTVTLHLTINEPTMGDTTAVECDSFDWYEYAGLTTSGDYTHVFAGGNAAGCDSIVTLHLTINEPTTGDTTAVECGRFDWYEHENLTRSGDYTHVFVGGNAAGCDSIVTLHLTIHEPTTGDTTAVECGSFDWYRRSNLTQSGDYTHVFVGGNANGCDSIVTLHLTINEPTTGDTTAVECGSFDWYERSNLTQSGDYTHVFAGGNANGCDSILTLHLTIHEPTTGDTMAVECGSFDWYERSNLTQSGDYTHVFAGGNANGCDSILTLHLTINEPTTGDTMAVECGSFDWYERSNLTQSGDYTHVFAGGNANGCDSILTLHLTINEPTMGDTTAVECDSFDWYEYAGLTTSGDYTHVFAGGNAAGCDSVVTLHLTINEPTTGDTTAVECGRFDWYDHTNITESGDYTHVFVGGNANGCDSVVVLHLLIQKPDTIRYDRTVCKGTRFQEYGFDTLMTTSGTYLLTRTLYAQQTPCDTLIELTLHVTEPVVVSTVAQSVCPSSNSVVVVAQFQNLSGDNNAVIWTSNNVVETHDNLVTPLHPKDSFTLQIPLNLCDDSLFYTVEYSDGICMVTETNFIHVVDTVPPAVNGVLPSLNLAGCSEDDVPSAFTNASEINALDNISIADNCTSMENITIQHSDSVVSASCDISIVRTYTLTDVCGNATRLMQDITLVRTSDFAISQVDTADTVICFSMALAENFTLPEVQDACGLVLQPSSDSPTVSGLDGSCEGSVRYTYTYRNCSGGDTVWTFTYHIALPDSFTSFPANGVGEVQCLGDVLPPTPPVVEDACGNTLNVTSLGSTENVNPDGSGTVDFLFRYSDCAGNDSVWTYTYTMTPNQFTPKPDLYDTVYCVSEALDDTVPVVTNCGIPVALTHGVDANRVEDGCGDMAYVYNYTVNDVHYTWTHYYHVTPVPFVLPANQECFIQCLDSAVQVEPPVVVNTCSDTIVPIALPVDIHSDGCSGYVIYAWDYADCSGGTARWTYTYVVADTTPPTFIVPADMVICRDTNGTYDADPAVTGIAIRISDNCSSLQEIRNSCQETLVEGANGVDTLLRQWIVKDNCDNENVQTQRITIMPVRYTTVVDSICEGEMYDTLNFNFVANVDTVVYQQLSSHETGCDSLITLNLTVFHPVNESDSVTTTDEYTWNGITYAQSGMYTHHHPDIHGCDQVDTLYLTIHYPSSSDIYDTACDIYTWNGVDYTESGVYAQHFTNEFNVDSTVVLHLIINHSKYTTIYDTVCYTYEWNGVVYTETGVYEQYFLTSDGCDSIVTLELRVNYNIETIIQENACEEYTWYDVTYTESGIYTKTLESSDLCDSTVILYLTINHDVSSEWWDTVCNVKQWNDEFYTESGEYVQHFETALGCDSAVTLHLVVNHSDTTVFDATGCDTYIWENIEYAQSGEYTRTFTNQFGCDSMVTMRLTIHSATYSTLYDTITQNSLPYDTLGMHFTEAGTKKDTILNQYGCDSIITMHLFVAQNVVVEVDSTICENDLPFTWNHVVFNQAGTMNDTLTAANGSDSIVVMTLNVVFNTYSVENEFVVENNLPHVFNGHTFTGPITYEQIVIPNANGCDSIITYSLQVWYNVKDTVERTICENDLPYSWNNVPFSAPGMQNAVFTLPNGADSVLTMVLFVHNNTQSTIYDTIVENGLPYDTLDMHFSDAGTLSDTIANANGCDSIVTMHLYVWYNVANTVDSTVCENNLPIVWNDVVFEAAGENTIVLVGNHGVDSVLTMRLAVIPKDVSVFHDEVCEGRDYFGHGFVVPGNQTVHIPDHHLSIENTFENELGCDSIVHLELDIVDTTVYIRPLFDFCDNMSTTLSVYTQMTDYVWSTGETSQNIDVTAPGLYSVTAMQGNCQSEAVISIEDCPTEIYLPNAITPGKLDGHNDCFSLPERCQNMIDEFEITIFNRWGQPVFHSKDKAFKWYGEYKDNVYRQNVYEYLIDYTENNRFHRKVKLRGSVVVL